MLLGVREGVAGCEGGCCWVLKKEHMCAAHIGMDGIRIEKEPRPRDEYVYRIS